MRGHIPRSGPLKQVAILLAISLLLWTAASSAAAADTDEIKAMICNPAYTWDCAKAIRVAQCESHPWLDERAYNYGQYGVFQVAYEWHSRRVNYAEELFDAAINVRVAHDIYMDNRGWTPWPTCGLR